MTESGAPDSKLFSSPDEAYSLARRWEDEDRENNGPKRKVISEVKNGSAPWKSRPQGLNINFGEARDILHSRMQPYVERLQSEREMVRVIPWDKDPTRQDDLGRRISVAASRAFNEWRGWRAELLATLSDMGDYGLGVICWDHDEDPKFSHVPRERAYFEAESTTDVDSHSCVVIKYEWSMPDVLAKLDIARSASPNGWNAAGLQALLRHMYDGPTDKDYNNDDDSLDELERRVRSNWMTEQVSGNSHKVYLLAAKNPKTGKIDQHIVSRHAVAGYDAITGNQKWNTFFLREKLGLYDRMSEFCCVIPLSGMTKYLHEARGHGHQIVPMAQMASRAKCQTVDHYNLAQTVWMSAVDQDAIMRSQMQRRGPFGVLEAGLEFQEFPTKVNYTESAGVLGLIDAEMKRGVPSNDPAQYGMAGNRPSATAERINQLDRASLTAAEAGTFDLALDALVGEFYRRLVTYGSRFKPCRALWEKFKDYVDYWEIPREIWQWKNIYSVESQRSIGSGSKFARQEIADRLMQARGALSPRGAHEAAENYIASYAGADHVRRFVEPYDQLGTPDMHTWQATMENNAFQNGGKVEMALGNQVDVVHMQTHLEFVQPIVQAVGQLGGAPAPPQQALEWDRIFRAVVPHLESHMARMESDPTQEQVFESMKGVFEETRRLGLHISRMAGEAEAQIERAAAAQQAAQQNVDPEQARQAQQLAQSEAGHQQKLSHDQEEHDMKMQQARELHESKINDQRANSQPNQ